MATFTAIAPPRKPFTAIAPPVALDEDPSAMLGEEMIAPAKWTVAPPPGRFTAIAPPPVEPNPLGEEMLPGKPVDLSGVTLSRPRTINPPSGMAERYGGRRERPIVPSSYEEQDYQERVAGTPKGVDARVLLEAVPFAGGVSGGIEAQQLQEATVRAKEGKATPGDLQILKAHQLDVARGVTTPAQIASGVAGSVRMGAQALIGGMTAGPPGALAGLVTDPGQVMSRMASQQTPETTVQVGENGKPTDKIFLGDTPSGSPAEAATKTAMLQASDAIIEMFGGKAASAALGAVGKQAGAILAKRLPETTAAARAFAKRYSDNTLAQVLDRAQIQGIAPEYIEEVLQSAAAAGIGEPGADPMALLDPTSPEAFNTALVIGVLNSPRLLGMFQKAQKPPQSGTGTTSPPPQPQGPPSPEDVATGTQALRDEYADLLAEDAVAPEVVRPRFVQVSRPVEDPRLRILRRPPQTAQEAAPPTPEPEVQPQPLPRVRRIAPGSPVLRPVPEPPPPVQLNEEESAAWREEAELLKAGEREAVVDYLIANPGNPRGLFPREIVAESRRDAWRTAREETESMTPEEQEARANSLLGRAAPQENVNEEGTQGLRRQEEVAAPEATGVEPQAAPAPMSPLEAGYYAASQGMGYRKAAGKKNMAKFGLDPDDYNQVDAFRRGGDKYRMEEAKRLQEQREREIDTPSPDDPSPEDDDTLAAKDPYGQNYRGDVFTEEEWDEMSYRRRQSIIDEDIARDEAEKEEIRQQEAQRKAEEEEEEQYKAQRDEMMTAVEDLAERHGWRLASGRYGAWSGYSQKGASNYVTLMPPEHLEDIAEPINVRLSDHPQATEGGDTVGGYYSDPVLGDMRHEKADVSIETVPGKSWSLASLEAKLTSAPSIAPTSPEPTPTPVQPEIVTPRAAQEPISATVEPVAAPEPAQPPAKPKRTPPPAKGSTSATGWSTVAKGVARKDVMGRTVELVRQADGTWSVTRDEREVDSGYKSRAEAEKYADGELTQDIRDQRNAEEEERGAGEDVTEAPTQAQPETFTKEETAGQALIRKAWMKGKSFESLGLSSGDPESRIVSRKVYDKIMDSHEDFTANNLERNAGAAWDVNRSDDGNQIILTPKRGAIKPTRGRGPAPSDTGIFRDLTAAARAGKDFVEELYTRVQPVLARIRAEAKNAIDFMRRAVAKIGEHIRPYAKRFLEDVRKVNAEFAANPTRGSVPDPREIMKALNAAKREARMRQMNEQNADYRIGRKEGAAISRAEKQDAKAETRAEERERAAALVEKERSKTGKMIQAATGRTAKEQYQVGREAERMAARADIAAVRTEEQQKAGVRQEKAVQKETSAVARQQFNVGKAAGEQAAKADIAAATAKATTKGRIAGVAQGQREGAAMQQADTKAMFKLAKEVLPRGEWAAIAKTMERIISLKARSEQFKRRALDRLLMSSLDKIEDGKALKATLAQVAEAKKRLPKLRPEIQQGLTDLLARFRMKDPTQRTVDKALDIIARAAAGEEAEAQVDPRVLKRASRIIEQYENPDIQSIRSLGRDELLQLTSAIKGLLAANDMMNSGIVERRKRAVRENNKVVPGEVKKQVIGDGVAGLDRSFWRNRKNDVESLYSLARGVFRGEDTIGYRTLVTRIVEGINREKVVSREFMESLKARLSEAGLDKKALNALQDERAVTLGNGKTIKMTGGEVADVLNHFKDPDTRYQLLKKKSGGLLLQRGGKSRGIRKLTLDDVRAIQQGATPEEAALADVLFSETNGLVRDRGNEWSESVNGTQAFPETDHWGRVREQADTEPAQDLQNKSLSTAMLESLSILKGRTGGDSPILVRDALTAYVGNAEKLARLIGRLESTVDARRMLDTGAVKEAIRAGRKDGNLVLQELQRRVEDIGSIRGPSDTWGMKTARFFGKGVTVAGLAGNVPVTLAQPMSVTSLSKVIPMKHLATPGFRQSMADSYREMQEADAGILLDIIEGAANAIVSPGGTDPAPALQKIGAKRKPHADVLLKPLSWFNDLAVFRAWHAAKAMGKAQGLSGKDLMDFTRDKATEAWLKTQPSPNEVFLSGSQLNARHNAAALVFTRFQGTMNAQMQDVLGSVRDLQDIPKGQRTAADYARLVSSLGRSIMLPALFYGGLKYGWDKAWDWWNEDDTKDREGTLAFNVLSAPVATIPVYGQLVTSAAEMVIAEMRGRRGFGLDNPVIGAAADVANALPLLTKLGKERELSKYEWKKLATAFAVITRLPGAWTRGAVEAWPE